MTVDVPQPERQSQRSTTVSRWDDFLGMVSTVTRAAGVALWEAQEGESPRLVAQHQLGSRPLDELQAGWPGHLETLQAVCTTQQVRTLAASFEQVDQTQALQLLFLPVSLVGERRHVLELFVPPRHELSVEQMQLAVQQLVAWASPGSVAADAEPAARFATWLGQIHRHLELTATAFDIVNETRVWSGWDRVSLLLHEGRGCRLLAISGVDVPDPRSSTVRSLEELGRKLRGQREVLLSTEQASAEQVQSYQSHVAAEQVLVLPLVRGGEKAVQKQASELLGFVICDRFPGSTSTVRPQGELVLASQQMAQAVQHALDYEQARGGLVARVRRSLLSRRFAKTALSLGMLVALLLFLCWTPAELRITGVGYLQPVQQQDVFAAVNGLIAELHVEPAATVLQGAPLVRLRSPELEFEINRIEGELQTVRQQIGDLEKLRTDPRRLSELRQSPAELATRGEELKTLEEGMKRQLLLLQQQQAELTLQSPLSGEVVTWRLAELLSSNRPVQRTDRLMTIANLDGPWQAELHLDYRDIGPVLEGFAAERLRVSFVTADAPEVPRAAVATKLSPVVTTDAVTGTTLKLEAEVDRASIPEVRPGTSILYRIDCGQAPLGYVWFRRAIDRVRTWWTML